MKRIKPCATNRVQTVQAIEEQLIEDQNFWNDSFNDNQSRWEYIEKPVGYATRLSRMFSALMNVTLASKLKGAEVDNIFKQSISYSYFSCQMLWHDILEGIEEEGGYNFTNPDLHKYIQSHGLFAEAGLTEMADWIAAQILISLNNETASSTLFYEDPQFHIFFQELMRISQEGKWPDEFDENKFGYYSSLLNAADDPVNLKEVLPLYCDYRCSNVFGWPDVDVKKRRKGENILDSVFAGVYWGSIIPFELLSLKYVYKKVTGKELTLTAEHPMLTSRFLDIPHMDTIIQDEWTVKLSEVASKKFSEEWCFVR